MNHYIYNHGNEHARQSSQAQIMHDQSLNLLQEAGLRQDMAVVDFGCGAADIAFSVSRMVGPVGKVLGVDCNPSLIHLNKKKTLSAATDNLTFRIGLAESYSDIFLYDIAFARFLMAHTRNPAGLVKNMLNLTKNYGRIALEDVDIRTMAATPFSPELEMLKTLLSALISYSGGDATIGPQLGTIMRWTGLQKIRILVHQPSGSSGHIKQVPLKVLESLTPTLLKVGLATPLQITRLKVGLQHLAEDDGVTLYFPTIYQAIGQNSHHLKFGPSKFT